MCSVATASSFSASRGESPSGQARAYPSPPLGRPCARAAACLPHRRFRGRDGTRRDATGRDGTRRRPPGPRPSLPRPSARTRRASPPHGLFFVGPFPPVPGKGAQQERGAGMAEAQADGKRWGRGLQASPRTARTCVSGSCALWGGGGVCARRRGRPTEPHLRQSAFGGGGGEGLLYRAARPGGRVRQQRRRRGDRGGGGSEPRTLDRTASGLYYGSLGLGQRLGTKATSRRAATCRGGGGSSLPLWRCTPTRRRG